VEISPEDVIELYGRKALFIDARRTDAYEGGHIAGARSMPVWEADVDARVAALYDEGRDQNAPVVIYCSGGACEDSHMLGQKLWGVGFDNVLVYKEGFPDWQKRGGAVARGPAP
jgi:rhodanese-related sulfurtransferase